VNVRAVKNSKTKMLTPYLMAALIGAICAHGEEQQSFLREPFDQTAREGEHVTLPCRVTNRKGVLQWTRDDFGLGGDRELTGFSRYRMTGSDEEGEKDAERASFSLFFPSSLVCLASSATNPSRSGSSSSFSQQLEMSEGRRRTIVWGRR